MTKGTMSTKTMARLVAIQVIYQYQLGNQEENILTLIQKMYNFYQNSEINSDLEIEQSNAPKLRIASNHLSELVKYTADNISILDEIITNYLTLEWKMSNMQPLLVAVMRVAIAELKFFPETPFKVVINEYSDIASDFLGNHEVGYVNSVLDKIAKANQ